MPHNHEHAHHHDANKNIRVAFILNLLFTLIEIVGGIWTNSMAILSDALHDLGDSLSLGIAWYLQKYSQKAPDQKFSFGYARFSLLSALINSLVLVGGSVLILTRTIPRIFDPQPVNAGGMIIFAIVGIIINGIAVLRLRNGTTLNEKVVTWHMLEDVLGWVVILMGSIVLMFLDIPIIDPILSVLITLYVLYHVVVNLKQILNIFLQGVPDKFSIADIEQEILDKTDATAAYHTHIWSLDGQRNLLSIHIVVRDDITRKDIIEIKQQIRTLIMQKDIEHVTIEVDFESEDKQKAIF